jgi:hypothetical protein
MLAFCANEWARHLSLMDKLPSDRIVDVQYGRIVSDMPGVVEEIYERRGLKLSREVAALMEQWGQENSQHRFGRLEYTLEEYGLSLNQIDTAFAGYLERFPETIAHRA